MTRARQHNPFYHPALLAGFGQAGPLPLERRPYGARLWRSDYTYTTAPRDPEAWHAELASEPRFVRAELLPEDGPAHHGLTRALEASGGSLTVLHRRSRPVAMLGPVEALSNGLMLDPRLSAQRRRTLRKQWRRLAEIGPVSLSLTEGEAALADFLPLEAAGWKGRAGTALAHRPEDLARLKAGFLTLAGETRFGGAVLRAGDHTVAAGLLLYEGDEAFFIKAAYDETLASLSPGALHAAALVAALSRNEGLRLIDSCATDGNAMIEALWPDRRAVLDVLIATRPTPPALTDTLSRALREAAAMKARVKALMRRRPG